MRFAALLAVLATTLLGGCRRPNSYLLVEVAGDLRLVPEQLQVAVDCFNPKESKVFNIPPDPWPITLPASFSIELDRNTIGPVVVYVSALGAKGAFIGSGQTRQEHIKVGDDTIIVVWLVPPDGGGDPDAGSGDPDAGDPDAGMTDDGGPDADPMDAEDQ
jgi:hypothetical protein